MRITIVGGGIIGLSAAVALLTDGHAVTVIDADRDRSAASWGNAGHIATEQTAPLASLAAIRSAHRRRFANGGALDLPGHQARHWLPFLSRFVAASTPARFAAGQRALTALLSDALPAWRALATAIGDPAVVRDDGHYVVWENARTARAGAAAWEAADTGTASHRAATAAERDAIAALTTAPIAGAIRFAGSGRIVDLDCLAAGLTRAVLSAGGRIVSGSADILVTGGRAAVAGHDADLVLIAAGARSGRLIAPAGHRAPLIAERGYHIRAAAGDWPADTPPIVFEDRSMIVTRYADTVQAASFVEFGAVDAAPDPRKWARLEAHVAALGLPLRAPFARWMGARPTLPDYLPAIGRSTRVPNLLYAFGHQHLGLTLAPVTAQIIAALARGDAPVIDIAPFAIERFGVRS
ncbi:NAD(P)/FAD-dependent oxidoreductase [Sphingomonas montana]|uniref:NAD(P)/FAD-dependent oxidoreductase n=1 Tax=Sphingomonas montana TaxID=1843236 RepID=UPI00096FF085|nr:FAD-binding oxidoreductase [Sphingomonas montana]